LSATIVLRLKEIKKRRALRGKQRVEHLINSVGKRTVVLLNPSFFYFFNPFFVIGNPLRSEQTTQLTRTAMKKFNITLILFLFVNLIYAQSPFVKQWDYRFGGIGEEKLYCCQLTADGGSILGGYSYSDSTGDKTQMSWGDADYWIVKVDSMGNKQWDKRFGGTSIDFLFSIQQTTDGGYILGGWSASDSSGDKTQDVWGADDYWIVKIDSLGNKQWDKDFGGSNVDRFSSLQQTADGGYILGGGSQSGISGDKTQANWDTINFTFDYWIVKIDSLGNKQWDKVFGGTSVDVLQYLQNTYDGGYILSGVSGSGISGDKTQPNWGIGDYWIVKIDSLGNKQWDKDYGGTNDDEPFTSQQTTDGGYILGGFSLSGISGDKTQGTWGGYDWWIVKIDSMGNKQWDKDFGGTNNEDDFGNFLLTADGGYLIVGNSYSPMSGDKTENNLGMEQTWVIKIDSIGIKKWDKTILTTGHDENGRAMQTHEGCYTFAIMSNAGIGGYKTQSNWDLTNFTSDYWIIKFCDTTTAINELQFSHLQFMIYPNPFTSNISIIIQKQNFKQASFTIKNILGQTVFHKQKNDIISPYTKTIDLSFLSKGMYFLEVIIDGERTVKKIVKE
jgi:type IX secretion system substrate protein